MIRDRQTIREWWPAVVATAFVAGWLVGALVYLGLL